MQRLFSMFPSGRPGWGLLLLRASVAVMLMDGIVLQNHLVSPAITVIASVVSASLMLGLFTPVAAVLCIALQFANWLMLGRSPEAIHLCAGLGAASLALLGPGSYSFDARLFGRRRVVVSTDDDSR